MARLTDLLLPPVLTGALTRSERKAAVLPPIGGYGNGGMFGQFVGPTGADYPSTRSYQAMVAHGFRRNPYLYRAVMITASACAAIPWLLYDKRGRGGERTEVGTHPLLDLVNAKANASEGAARLWTRLHANLLLAGDAYLIAITPDSQRTVTELYAVRPDRMTPELLQDRITLKQWVYEVGNLKRFYPPEVVRRLTEFSPEDIEVGLAPARVAARSVDQHNAANDWNTALLQNMARPSGMLSPKSDAVIPADAKDQLEHDLQQKYAGARNAGRPLLARFAAQWLQIGTNPSDMDWLSGKIQAAREVAIALGVPPELLGDAANKTYSNLSEARRSFYTETVLPRMDGLRGELNSWLLPLYGLDTARYELDYDTDEIEALQEDRQVLYQRAYDGWDKGLLTLNQALHLIGETEEDGPLGDVRLVPTGKSTLEEVVNPTQPEPPPLLVPAMVPDPKPADTVAAPAPADALPAADSGQPAQPPAKALPLQSRSRQIRATQANKALDLSTEEQKAAHWRKTEQTREQWYTSVEGQIRDRFGAEADDVLAAIRAAPNPDGAYGAAAKALASHHEEWLSLLAAIHIAVGDSFTKQVLADLDVVSTTITQAKLTDAWEAEVVRWLRSEGAARVTGISETTRTAIQDALAEGVTNGEGVDQLAKRIDALYLDQIIPHRSETIARTEVISSSAEASLYTARQSGLTIEKEWIATRDGRTREEHAEADGQRVPLDSPFLLGGVETDGPGLSGDPSLDINCRCAVGLHVIGDNG